MTSSPTKAVWNPADYAANSAAQLAWARELIAKLNLRGDERMLDVGCGDGKITAELARALPRGEIVGVDSSMEMIAFARKAFPKVKFGNLTFQSADARKLASKVGRVTPCAPRVKSDGGAHGMTRPTTGFDVIFSNATLHWVDDHPAFLRGAATSLKAGGRLVISCGGKGNAQDVFLALRATLRTKRWRGYFRKLAAAYFFHRPEDYEKWLPRFGFRPTLVRLVNKDVQFGRRNGLAAWIRTTWLPYTQRVPLADREAFIVDVVERFVAKHPADAADNLTIRMVRLEIDAIRI